MKLQLKSALKTNFDKIRCIEDSQIVHSVGNNLYIIEVGKSEGDFIGLDKQNTHLYDFVVSPNNHYIFTAELVREGLQINSYNLKRQKKTIRLSDFNNYLPMDLIQNIQLLPDQMESQILFVLSRTKSQVCISLLDMVKLKMISHGFMNQFNNAVSCSQQLYQISICGKTFVRRLKALDGGWIVQEKLPKKLSFTELVLHQWLSPSKLLVTTRAQLFICQQNEVLQTINVTSEQDPLHHIIKLTKGFLTLTQKHIFKLYAEEVGESAYTEKQKNKLNFGKCTILQAQINKKSQNLYLVSSDGKLYQSSLEEISSNHKQNNFSFEQTNMNYSLINQGTITTSHAKNLCLISNQKKIQLWDIQKFTPTIVLQVSSSGEDRIIKSSAINPDGYSFCVAYSDKARFYRILLNKFRQFGQYSIKSVSIIKYSHCGQLIAFIFGKGTNSTLTIINTFNLKDVFSIKLGYKASFCTWNQTDDQICISGQQLSSVYIYQVSTKSKKSIISLDNLITAIRFDYLTKKLLISTQHQIYLVDSNQNKSTIKPKINDFLYIYPIQGHYLAVDNNGGLYYSTTIQFDKFNYLPLFIKQKYNLLCRRGLLIAYTSITNIIVLKIKQTNQLQNMISDENIILIEKQQINKFFQKIKYLQSQVDQFQHTIHHKLEEQKKTYKKNLQENQQIFKNQIEFIQNKLNNITVEKTKQQKNNIKIFTQLQIGQINSVNELEKIYDNKIKLQKQKYLTLEQQFMEEKLKYENIIKNLQNKCHSDIQKIRKQYSNKLNQQIKNIQSQKNRHLDYKKNVQTKIISLQQQGQMALHQLQTLKDNKITQLIDIKSKLQRQHDAKIITLHNMQQDMNQLTIKYTHSIQMLKSTQKQVQQLLNKISILQQQIHKKNHIIEQKNILIDQQIHQIDGLQKAKYVLSSRTTQVRKQLQPKQFLIQKLKSQLFKLNDEYKVQIKKNFQLNQKMQKLLLFNTNSKKQIYDIKTLLKTKQKLHNQLCYQIFYIINNIDHKDWNQSFIKIYQTYIQQQQMKLKIKKKDNNTSQQINRHLIHVQQSLFQVASGNDKILKTKQKQIIRKMKQNAQLVYDLNLMRKKQNQYQTQIKQKNTQISKLKRQLQQVAHPQKSSTRLNTANTGVTRKILSRDTIHQNQQWNDLSLKKSNDFILFESKKRGRVFSAHKTMLWRDESRRQKSKISDIAKQLQSAKNTIMRQDRMIQQLNQRLLGLPEQNT